MNLKNLRIKTRLIIILALASLLLISLGTFGLVNLQENNVSAKTVYEDRVLALGDLGRFARRMLRTHWYLTLAAVDGTNRENQAEEIRETVSGAQEAWGRFRATYLTDEEKKLSAEIENHTAALERVIYEPAIRAILSGDTGEVKRLSQLSKPMYAKVRVSLDKIIQLQLDVAKAEYDAGQANYTHARDVSIAAIVVGLACIGAMGWWIIGSITAPMANAVDIARSVANGDLTREIDVKSSDEVGQLLAALAAMNAGLLDIIGKVRSGADLISTASSEIAQGNLDLSARTEQQASSLEETASSLEELTSTVKQNADNALHASSMAASAAQTAERGGVEVQQAVETMGAIRESSARIVEIIAVIDGIAFQTNILALNAAVEAARAGEQGRGFAVVASEVRSLAQRSAAAAKEIKDLITSSVDRINEGSSRVEHAGQTMQEVVGSIAKVRDLVGEISSASREQTMGIEQINEAVAQMDQVTQQNAALVEQAAAAAQSMEEQAAELKATASVFKLQAAVNLGAHAAPARSRLRLQA